MEAWAHAFMGKVDVKQLKKGPQQFWNEKPKKRKKLSRVGLLRAVLSDPLTKDLTGAEPSDGG